MVRRLLSLPEPSLTGGVTAGPKVSGGTTDLNGSSSLSSAGPGSPVAFMFEFSNTDWVRL